MDNEYENLDTFQQVINAYHETLGKKYNILDHAFDVECIYGKEDLTGLVLEMLELGGFKPQNVKDGHDLAKKQYYTTIVLNGKTYEFRTSSEGDYVDLETVFPALQQITKDLRPEFEYNFSNRDGGQVAFLIFAKSSDLISAVDEGYPCSLESGKWTWDKQWKWGVYSDIELDIIPDFADLKLKYHQTLKELYEKGYNVPNLTLQRIYMDDIFKKNIIDIVIDGGPSTTSFNDIVGKKVRCYWEGWGVALAYTLIQHYNGKPTLFDKEERKTTPISPSEYLKRAESAFGLRN